MRELPQALHVQSMTIEGRHYEQRYQLCSKEKCWCATREGRERRQRTGHGPYWYRVIKKDHGFIRRYIGRELKLDPGKLRLDDHLDLWIQGAPRL